jgi:hypothetical protein
MNSHVILSGLSINSDIADELEDNISQFILLGYEINKSIAPGFADNIPQLIFSGCSRKSSIAAEFADIHLQLISLGLAANKSTALGLPDKQRIEILDLSIQSKRQYRARYSSIICATSGEKLIHKQACSYIKKTNHFLRLDLKSE